MAAAGGGSLRSLKRLVPAALLACGACSPIYVLRAGYEEAKILSRREPIAKLVADSTTPPEKRHKLRLVLEAREFARDSLGLDVGKSYTTFSQLDSDTLALIVSAAYRDRFEPYTWWFPIVGRMPYKGYFSEEAALNAIADLEEKGLDTYLRPTAAFSTLGWFNDPMVSPLLRYDSVSLASTVIHELLHNTLYLSGEGAFNESFANFVGARGAIAMLCGRNGQASQVCRRAEALWQDELLFGEFLSGLVAELEALYARDDVGYDAKMELREEIFERAQRTFEENVQPRLRVATFSSFSRVPLNNAVLLSRRLYYKRLDLFERLYHGTGGDLRKAIDTVLEVAEDAEDPYAAVEAMVPGGAP